MELIHEGILHDEDGAYENTTHEFIGNTVLDIYDDMLFAFYEKNKGKKARITLKLELLEE